jgi:hypothetical protein
LHHGCLVFVFGWSKQDHFRSRLVALQISAGSLQVPRRHQ